MVTSRQPVRPLAGDERTRVQGPLVESSPRHRARPHQWQDVRLVDEATLEVAGLVGPGQGVDRVEVDESDDLVLVTVWVGDDAETTGLPRRAIGVGYHLRVPLGSPLGDRLVADGARPTPEEHRAIGVAHARARRAELGLPADQATVEALWDAAPAHIRATGDTPFTVDEQAWLDELDRACEAARDFAAGWCGRIGGDVDAGGWIDWTGGPTWVQKATCAGDNLRAAAEDAGVRRLRVEPAEHPYSTLLAVTDAIAQRSNALGDELAQVGVRLASWGPDVKANRVRVQVIGDTEAAHRLLASVVNPALLAVEELSSARP